jgi:hypothetical protein
VRIERIISHGHASPADFWYDQPQHEWVIVLRLHCHHSRRDTYLIQTSSTPGEAARLTSSRCLSAFDNLNASAPIIFNGSAARVVIGHRFQEIRFAGASSGTSEFRSRHKSYTSVI